MDCQQSSGIYIREEEMPNFTTKETIIPNHDPKNPYITLSDGVELCGVLENYVHDFIMYRQDFWSATKQSPEDEFSDFLWAEVFSAIEQKQSKQYIIGTSRFLSCEKELVTYSKSNFQVVKGRLLRRWAARVRDGEVSCEDKPRIEAEDIILDSYSDYLAQPISDSICQKIISDRIHLKTNVYPILFAAFSQMYIQKEMYETLCKLGRPGIEPIGGVCRVYLNILMGP